jgi:hypothetical protein
VADGLEGGSTFNMQLDHRMRDGVTGDDGLARQPRREGGRRPTFTG